MGNEKEKKDTMSRKWQITINNPFEKGFTHDAIRERLSDMKNVIYWCMSDEIGDCNTYHTHIYLQGKNGIRFSTIDKRFKGGHYEIAKGTAHQNMEYVSKTGKWQNDKKHETSVAGTFEEWGDMPIERQGKRNDLDDLYAMIKQGLTDYEILEQDASYMMQIDKIEKARQVVLSEEKCRSHRNVDVTYIYGLTGTGKTRDVMEKHGYDKVYRITNYKNPFDMYHGEDIIVFDEFRSNLPFSELLNYTDGYPCWLPCRYNDRRACYSTVYIISNWTLGQQYPNIQENNQHDWQALLRRIKAVRYYDGKTIQDSKMQITADGFYSLIPTETTPFER